MKVSKHDPLCNTKLGNNYKQQSMKRVPIKNPAFYKNGIFNFKY